MDERTGYSETASGSAGGSAGREPGKRPVEPLQAAIRRARVEEAEHSEGLAELRGAEMARLEMLLDALQPVLAEVPPDVDLFDVGLLPSEHPRLFIDMIGFVEMARDRRLYRFVQDTRHGRIKIAESDKIDPMVKAVTDYIARRLVEREKALAADAYASQAHGERRQAARGAEPPSDKDRLPREKRRPRAIQQLFGFMLDLFGSMVLFTLLAAGAYYILSMLATGAISKH